MKKQEIQQIGTFKSKSGKFIVSDPCYKKGEWCMGTLENVKKGEWRSFLNISDEGDWGNRVAELIVVHENISFNEDTLLWSLTDINVGVDSGQAGIFDDATYRQDSVIENEPVFSFYHKKKENGSLENGDRWYAACCDKTIDQTKNVLTGGIITGGAVSSSGYGDGLYDCFISTDDNKEIIAVKIAFILENDEDSYN